MPSLTPGDDEMQNTSPFPPFQIDRTSIEAAIVKEAASAIISDDDLYGRVKREIDARVEKLFAERAETKITAVIDEAIQAGFERPYRKHDSFGRPTGEPTTISAELERLVGGYWNTFVDRDGKPVSSSYEKTTRAEWLMAKMCAADFQKEVQQHAVNVAAKLKDGFRRELHETVNRLLSELFHVRSLDDQAENRRDSSIIQPKAGA